jgi:hypothetical protein
LVHGNQRINNSERPLKKVRTSGAAYGLTDWPDWSVSRTLPARLSRRAALELVKFSLDYAAPSALFVVIRLDL